jgi:signal transduction histidine kinase
MRYLCLVIIFLLFFQLSFASNIRSQPEHLFSSNHSLAKTEWNLVEGLSNSAILPVLKNCNGYIWVDTYNGLAQFDEYTFKNLTQETNTTLSVNGSDNLATDPDVNRLNSLGSRNQYPYLDSLAGSEKTSIAESADEPTEPKYISQVINKNAPKPLIEQVQADGKEVATVGANVSIPAGTKYLDITYSGLNFTAPEELYFKYRLQGFDKNWIIAGIRRQAFYTNLPPGNYKFELQAVNEDGLPVTTLATLALRQEAYIYETVWFKILVTLTLISLCVLAYKLRIHHLARVNERLSRLVAARTRNIQLQKQELLNYKNEVSQLNGIKCKLLSVLSHDLCQPFTSTSSILKLFAEGQINAADLQKTTDLLSRQMIRQVHTLDNIIEWTRSQLTSLEAQTTELNLFNLVEELIEANRSEAVKKDIALVIDESVDTFLVSDFSAVQLVLRNFMSNALKFTPKRGTITISLNTNFSSTYISVTDTGIGLTNYQIKSIQDQEVSDVGSLTRGEGGGRGLGLILARKFAHLCGGSIKVESSVGIGSTFTLVLPNAASKLSSLEVTEVIAN